MKFYYKATFKIYRASNKNTMPETINVFVTAKNTTDAYHNAQKVKNELKGINPDDKVICTRKDIVCRTKPNALAEISTGVPLYDCSE